MLRKRLEFLRTHTRSNLITWQPMQRRIDELVEKLKKAYILIVTEISRLGKSTAEIIHRINKLLGSKIRIIAVKQKLDISNHEISSRIILAVFSLMTELERYLVILEQCLTPKIVALQN